MVIASKHNLLKYCQLKLEQPAYSILVRPMKLA